MLNGASAADYMWNGRPNTANACLYTVWLAFGSPHSLGSLAGYTFPTAVSAYNYTTRRHTDRNPPRGVPVWFGSCAGPRYAGDAHWQDGDVTVSLGGGNLGATDYPSFGHIGQCTIAQREAQTGRAYLGWTEDFLGNDIDFGQTVKIEDDMSAQAEQQINQIFNAIFNGGTSMEDSKQSISRSLAQINNKGALVRIQSSGRGIALIGPGYYRHLNTDEEVTTSALIMSKHLNVDDRQFDVLVALVQQGQVPPVTTDLTVDYAKLGEALVASQPQATTVADVQAAAKQGVTDAFNSSTITVVPKS